MNTYKGISKQSVRLAAISSTFSARLRPNPRPKQENVRSKPQWPKRYLLILGTFLLSMLLYVDRACISTAKEATWEDLQLSNTQWGWVMAAFSLGYAIFQTPAGLLAVATWLAMRPERPLEEY